MKRRGVWQALLLLAALTAWSCGPEPEGAPPEAPGTATHTAQLRFRPIHKALVLSTHLPGEASSREALAAAEAGLSVHVVTPAQWSMMTAEQFNDYKVLIIGDESCTEDGSSALQAANDTRRTWGPIVDGHIFVIASNPSTNHTPVLVERGVEFAAARDNATGLYVSLGCTYQGAAPGTAVTLLEPFGDFLMAGVGCHPAAHVFVMSPKELTSELYGNDDRLTGDRCAARTVFTHYPEQTFATVALAVDTEGSMPGARPYTDPYWNGSGGIFVGSPYVLARGALPRTPSSPPVAQCRDLVLDADQTCGASGSINDGSNDPDGDLVGCTQSPAGPYPLGATTVTLTCTDSEQQSSSCTATVHVRDVTAPELALVGSASQQIECRTAYADPGAAANDFCDGDLTGEIIRTGEVDVGTPGSYGLTYDVEDSSGNRASTARRTVTVSDTLPPVVTLHPPLNQTLECGTPYIDPGLTVIDRCFGDLTDRFPPMGGINSNAPGTYLVAYSATDPVGNRSAPQHRTVNVVDTLHPDITVLPPLEDSCECGSTYVDPGATATDRCFGEVAVTAVRVGNPNQPSSFTITYSASDAAGNSFTSPVVRHVTVTDDEPPVLTLLGPNPQVLECGPTPYTDPGATATDQCFGDMTSQIVRTGSVNTRVPGTYPLTYNVTDPNGNSAVPVNRTVYVRDTQPPAVTINLPLNMTADCRRDATFVDPGASAVDLCAGPVPVQRTGEVDLGQPGVYVITYTVRDPSGNGRTLTRTVTVIDRFAPVLTLIGPGFITIEQGTPYVDPGATAHDACEAEIPITLVGHVDTDVPGTYLLRYIALDRSGNRAEAVRTVVVVAATPGMTSRTSTPAR